MVRVLPPEEIARMEKRTSIPPVQKSTALEMPSEMLINNDFHQRMAEKHSLPPKSQITSNRSDQKPSTVSAVTSRVPNRDKGEDWVRQELLCSSILYTEDTFLRTLDTRTLKKLAGARAASSYTQMIDALDAHINIDIRDLSVPDLTFMMYWLKMNSYPRTGMTIHWTSKYGNENMTRVSTSDRRSELEDGIALMEINEIQMTKEELYDWQQQGITIPTVRDMEVLLQDLSTEDEWEIRYAQYMYVEGPVGKDFLDRKIAAFHDAGPEIVSLIDEFSEKIKHGVIEQIKARDKHFDLDRAILSLTEQLDSLGELLTALQTEEKTVQTGQTILGLIAHIDDRQQDLKRLYDAQKSGIDFTPDEEVVNVGPADINMLFPGT